MRGEDMRGGGRREERRGGEETIYIYKEIQR